MTNIPSRLLENLLASRTRGVVLALAAGGLVLAASSCRTVTRTTVMLPEVAGGSEYIGSKECESCHPKIYQDFQTADHSLLVMGGPNTRNAGCESCHGPGSLHSESGGETKPPYVFAVGRPVANTFGANLATPSPRAVETVCYTCHSEVRGQFGLPSHHPVPEGRMGCTACHSPHKGSVRAGGGTALHTQNDNCLKCHPEQRGPYVFEHEAMREGCLACHGAHGAVNAKMLKVRNSNLCLTCHFQQVQGGQILIGGSDHTVRVQQGTCWTAGCHEAVHGSRVNSSLRF